MYNKYGLILIAENDTNSGEFNNSEPLEEELVLCVETWHKHFPMVDIYVVCPSNKTLPTSTINTLPIHYYNTDLNTDKQPCGYYNIPIGLEWAEQHLPKNVEYFIHIDLDMTTLCDFELPHIMDDSIYIGRLNDTERKPFHLFKDMLYTFESNFIMTRRDNIFFTEWNRITQNILNLIDSRHIYYTEIEEFAIDYIYKWYNKKYNIIDMIDYQIGSRYPLKNINTPKNVKFHHNHLYESKMEYIKWKLLNK